MNLLTWSGRCHTDSIIRPWGDTSHFSNYSSLSFFLSWSSFCTVDKFAVYILISSSYDQTKALFNFHMAMCIRLFIIEIKDLEKISLMPTGASNCLSLRALATKQFYHRYRQSNFESITLRRRIQNGNSSDFARCKNHYDIFLPEL